MEFIRKQESFRFDFGGLKTNSSADSIPPNKYPLAINIRSLNGKSVISRSGQAARFSTGGNAITDLRAYSRLSTDDLPRVLARDILDQIYLDTGVQIGTLSGGGIGPGATMIPFRPNASPTPYMYIANGSDFQKFSAPTATGVVTASRVGIAEPQSPCDACPLPVQFSPITLLAGTVTASGTAGAASSQTRITDAVVASFSDPTQLGHRSVQVATTVGYQTEMQVQITHLGTPTSYVVEDVLPPVAAGNTLLIRSIFYYAGASGRCVIACSQMGTSTSLPQFFEQDVAAESIFAQQAIASLRRGALISFATSPETALVLNATIGPDGSICFECSTVNTHAAGEAINGAPAIVVDNSPLFGFSPGDAISSTAVASAVTAGLGFLSTSALPFNLPFQQNIGGFPVTTPQQDDYIHLSVLMDAPQNLIEGRILIDVGDGTFTQNYYYWAFRASDLQQAVSNAQTTIGATQVLGQRSGIDSGASFGQGNALDLDTGPGILGSAPGSLITSAGNEGASSAGGQAVSGANQWTELLFPASAMTRVGNDETKTLANANATRVQVNVSATTATWISSLWLGGGGAPDVGDIGQPYLYRVRPRSSITGAIGNPSPAMRYGVSPRRQPVGVALPSAAYDSQIDTYDVFRFGGTVTSWRYIGSVPTSLTTFEDNFSDFSAQSGNALDFDNFEPWVTIDLPLSATASSVCGTTALVIIPSPTLALRYLPGNFVILGGNNVFTLWTRPTLISGSTYLLQFQENAGSLSTTSVQIVEPSVARQPLPYMFGPDSAGRILAVGDPLRPGVLYYTKSNNPDSAPDSYSRELTVPSEPLLGGEILDGLAFVASPERWWALYPQQSADPTQFYNPVQAPIARGLAAPLGHCTDGAQVYFWAKDGIWASQTGSLTDADLFNLFPHDGVAGTSVTYLGVTIQAPDYSRVGKFRLTHSAGYLYATYQDASGTYRQLVLDIKRAAWSVDQYSPVVSAAYHPEQQAGTITANTAVRYDELLFGTIDGRVCAQSPLANDLGGGVVCTIATFEFDGGDLRAPTQWGDFFVDLTPSATNGVIVQPVSSGARIAIPTTIPSTTSRMRPPVSVGGIVVSDFMGLVFNWTDDYTIQSANTHLRIWQPSYDLQPSTAIAWRSFGSALDSPGFKHIARIALAWVSTAPVTLTFFVVDGQAPSPIILPSSGGVYTKQLFTLTANKGQMYSFAPSSTQPFQLFMNDSELYIGQWSRTGPYDMRKDFGVASQEEAVI